MEPRSRTGLHDDKDEPSTRGPMFPLKSRAADIDCKSDSRRYQPRTMLAKFTTSALAVAALLGSVGATPRPLESQASSLRATNATAFAITVCPLGPPSGTRLTPALQYGYPLIQYASTVHSVLALTGSNAIRHNRDLATAEDVSLVRPNVDTLYSRVVVDLSHNDVYITIPKVDGDRYYAVAFYDLSVRSRAHGDA